jgi:hypothetical protein
MQPSQQETQRIDKQLSAGLRPEIITHQSRTWLVRSKENIVVAPRCRQIVVGRLESEKGQSLPPLVCVEPTQIPIEGILPARALSRVKSSALEPSLVTSPVSCSENGAPSNCAYVMENFSQETLTGYVAEYTEKCILTSARRI